MWWWRGNLNGGLTGLDHRRTFREALKSGAEEQCGLEALQEASVGALQGCGEQGCGRQGQLC